MDNFKFLEVFALAASSKRNRNWAIAKGVTATLLLITILYDSYEKDKMKKQMNGSLDGFFNFKINTYFRSIYLIEAVFSRELIRTYCSPR